MNEDDLHNPAVFDIYPSNPQTTSTLGAIICK